MYDEHLPLGAYTRYVTKCSIKVDSQWLLFLSNLGCKIYWMDKNFGPGIKEQLPPNSVSICRSIVTLWEQSDANAEAAERSGLRLADTLNFVKTAKASKASNSTQVRTHQLYFRVYKCLPQFLVRNAHHDANAPNMHKEYIIVMSKSHGRRAIICYSMESLINLDVVLVYRMSRGWALRTAYSCW